VRKQVALVALFVFIILVVPAALAQDDNREFRIHWCRETHGMDFCHWTKGWEHKYSIQMRFPVEGELVWLPDEVDPYYVASYGPNKQEPVLFASSVNGRIQTVHFYADINHDGEIEHDAVETSNRAAFADAFRGNSFYWREACLETETLYQHNIGGETVTLTTWAAGQATNPWVGKTNLNGTGCVEVLDTEHIGDVIECPGPMPEQYYK